jgi:predicted nucleotide-binding protein
MEVVIEDNKRRKPMMNESKPPITNRLNGSKKRTYIPQTDIPRISLNEALKIPKTILDSYGGSPTKPLHIAKALEIGPTGSTFKNLCGAAIAYGLTAGGSNAKEVSVLPLTKRILRPTKDGDDLLAMREAILKPVIINKFLTKYKGSPLPSSKIACNVLEDMGVAHERVEEVYEMIINTAKSVGIISDIKDKHYIDFDSVGPSAEEVEHEDEENLDPTTHGQNIDQDISQDLPETNEDTLKLGKGIFIAHGKNKKALEQLKRILDQFKVIYKVAIEEPNLGRPISQKVKDSMKSCNSAILIFTADEEFFDKDGNSIWRPSENVVFELGAAGYLYENQIVILKEDKVIFPSNFSDIGYISFSNGQLEAKTLDVVKELIGFGILKVTT